MSICITLATIAVTGFVAFFVYQKDVFENITVLSMTGVIFLALFANYFRTRASKIAEVLEIEKCLKKYGIETEE